MSLDEALAAVRATVDSIPEDQRGEGSDILEFVLRSTDEARARYEGADGALITPSMTSRLDEALRALGTEIQGQVAAADGVNWDVVRRAAYVVLDALPLLPPTRSSDVEVVTSREQVERLAARSQQLEEEMSRLGEQIEGEIASIQNKVAETGGQHETRQTELRQRLDELAAVIDTQKTALSDALDKQQTAFRADQEQRRDEQKATLDELKAAATDAVEEFKQAATTEREKTREEANKHLDTLKQFLEEAKEVHGAIGRTAMASGYQEQATQEEVSADRFRRYAIGFGLGSVAVLLAAIVFSALGAGVNTLLAKAIASAALGALATYSAKQSGDHRATARRLRSTYLAIASLGPYLSTIKDDTVREQVVRTFAYIFFAAPQQGESPDESIQTVKALMDMARELGQPAE